MAMSLLGIDRRVSYATHDVLSVGDNFQMFSIDAVPNPAQVVNH